MTTAMAARALAAKRSAIRVLFDAAQDQPDVIRLEIGEPSFTTPDHIIAGAMAAAQQGFTRYGPNGGLTSLRELLVDKLQRVDGYAAHPDQVVVTTGGMNALFSIYLALLEPGDEVLLPTPGFPNMDEMVRLLGGVPVFYDLRREEGYLPNLEQIGCLITPRTKVLFINTPGNPTGAVFPAETMAKLVELATRRDIWLLSDEVYDELVLDPGREHVSAAHFGGEGRLISVYSFSKVYAMTGWRVGYCVAPAPLAEQLRKLQEPQYSCPSTISQKAAEAALLGPREPIAAMRQAYCERLDRAWQVIESEGLTAFRTQGTIYMTIDVSAAAMPSMDFALRLLAEERVTVAPGVVFGPGGESLVRISLAASADQIEEGLRRLARAVPRFAEEEPR